MTKHFPVPEPHFHITNGVQTYAWSRDLGRAQRRMLADNRTSRLAGGPGSCRVYPCYNPECFVFRTDKKE
jgi:hypothetical protein